MARLMAEQSLAEFMASIAEADDPDLELARRTLEAAGAEHPELPFVIRAGAIARQLDAKVIGVLRGAPEDVAHNDELASLVSRQAFVSLRAPGSYVFHDNMRRRLLRDWESGDEHAEFVELNSRLLDYFLTQHEAVVAASRELARVGRVIRRASPDRYVQLATELERSLLAPLLEALYHAAVLGPEEAYEHFVSAYELHESAGRLDVCDAALSATREFLARVQPGADSASAVARLEYWEGRLLVERRRYAEAETVLLHALEYAHDEAFDLRIRRQLVTALLALDRLPDAIEACEKHKALAERADDVVEVYLSTYQLATLKWTLEELVAAAGLFAEAVSSAQSLSNNRLDAFARLGLAGVLSAGGRTDDAFAQAFRAFDISRTEALDDESLASTVVDRFADLFGRTDRRHADTLYAEARALAPVADDSQLALDQRIRYVNILRTSGQVRRARRVLEAAKERAREETAELLLEDALTQEISGSPDPAIDLYDRIVALEESGAPPFVVAAAYANRAQQVALRGEWERSFADLDAAGERWRTTGYERLRVLIEVWRASILRRSGAVSEAAPTLAAAEELPLPESAGYLADYFEARAGVHEASARWADAGSDYGAAFERRDSVGDVAGAAQAASDAARACARGGRWSDAARRAQAATTAWESAAEADAYEPDTSIRAADEENARGIALMFGSRREPDQARELFESALERVPDHRWYALNLATACAACREWTAAADALERFLDGAPAYLQDSDLFYRLADYRINRAEDLEGHGEPAAALDAYGRARASLADDAADGRLLIVANRLGEAYLRLDRLDLALHEFQKGLSLAQTLGSDPAAAVFERRLAIVAAIEGDADRATALALSSFARSEGARWTGFWTLVREGSFAPPAKRGLLRRVLRDLALELKNGGEMNRFESTISIGQPPDWAAKESVTLSDPSGRANVIVSIEPVPVGTTSQEYADAIGEQFREEEFAEFQELAVTETELTDGGSAILRRFSWTPSESARVTQMQLYRVDGARGMTATATTSSASFPALELELEQVLLSVAVGSTRMPAPTSD